MTSPQERVVRDGWESRVPRTPDEFATLWKNSLQRAALVKEIDEYNNTYTLGGEHLSNFQRLPKDTTL